MPGAGPARGGTARQRPGGASPSRGAGGPRTAAPAMLRSSPWSTRRPRSPSSPSKTQGPCLGAARLPAGAAALRCSPSHSAASGTARHYLPETPVTTCVYVTRSHCSSIPGEGLRGINPTRKAVQPSPRSQAPNLLSSQRDSVPTHPSLHPRIPPPMSCPCVLLCLACSQGPSRHGRGQTCPLLRAESRSGEAAVGLPHWGSMTPGCSPFGPL